MDLRSILTVKTILAEGSFKKAAERLNYTQSTITFQVRQLENELSVQLFERVGRRMILTRAGRDLLPHMETILGAMREIHSYGEESRSLKGELRVAVSESLLTYRMQPVIKAFIEQAPAVKIFLCTMHCPDIRDAVLAGTTDIGIYYNIEGHQQTMVVHELCEFALSLVVSPALPLQSRDFNTPGREKDLSLVINEPRSKYREIIESYLRDRKIMLRNTIELWSVEAIKRSVTSNLGFSFLPTFSVERELQEGTLEEVGTEIPEKTVTIVYAYHKNKRQSPAMELFTKLLTGAKTFRSSGSMQSGSSK